MEITALKKTVNGLFTVTHQYQVPVFQRPYAWQPKQLGELWNDIFDADVDGHFLGPVVLFKTKSDDEDSIREVIDGQQRLASLQILLAIIRDTWIELNQTRHADTPNGLIFRRGYFPDEEDRFVFRSNDRNWAFFRDFILRAPDDRSASRTPGPKWGI